MTTHLVEPSSCLHLLGEQHGLNSMEQTFEPPHELSVRDPQLRITGNVVVLERKAQTLELLAQFG
jgi:hypothetical protein